MATKEYLPNVAEELVIWSEKLHALSKKIDTIPSIDKYKILPHIEELHMIMTEMDDRLCQIIETDPASLRFEAKEVRNPHRAEDIGTTPFENELFDYDFGG